LLRQPLPSGGIEDKGSGTSLIQALKAEGIYAYRHDMKLEGNKDVRLSAQAVKFYMGEVHFLAKAPWLDELIPELLGFPNTRPRVCRLASRQ
jgi:predicted phage terminase large subunit-like protein